ncbi:MULTISPECIES: flavin monoamine oxidase family protein [unclassified Spirosoma]|uniref:flavin monoamine oxidase family protein n=1 Tax=unclassified Spirosoma TaxID=2621999 RepID=UPI00095B4B52|nr:MULTISPECIES: flavin monoamine oxidase family protein [unclassified Spirosoma]MBN8823995.1 flavin monoamine oxidase family protein [Spirosoma sp.]OJW70406.1 MAG: monoamine oxidase [Spirosoma sp. 48-14]
MTEPTTLYDVVVIGAGYAGLTAMHELLKAGKTVLLIEARDRVGGRVWTQRFDDGTYVDLGGAWVGPTQDRLYALAREFGVETYKTYDEGKSTQYFRGQVKRYKGLIPPLPIGALLSLDAAIKKLNKLSKAVHLAEPWATPNASYLDSMTLASWMNGQMRFDVARQFFKVAAEAIWAADPAEISLLHALFYTKSCRDLDTLMNIKNGAQEERFVGGAQTIAERLAATYTHQLVFDSPVKAVIQDGNHISVVTSKETYKAKRVIITVPPALQSRIDFQPILPAQRAQLIQRMPMGSVWKCYAIYEKPFWREQGLNGLAATPDGHVTVTFDNSPNDGSYGVLMGFVLGNQAKAFTTLSDSDRKLSALHSFATFFGTQALSPVRYLDHSFMNEEWSRGCYAGLMGPGIWTTLGPALRQPVGRIHWAGTETSDIWNGYIDGAIRSGERVAAEVMMHGE